MGGVCWGKERENERERGNTGSGGERERINREREAEKRQSEKQKVGEIDRKKKDSNPEQNRERERERRSLAGRERQGDRGENLRQLKAQALPHCCSHGLQRCLFARTKRTGPLPLTLPDCSTAPQTLSQDASESSHAAVIICSGADMSHLLSQLDFSSALIGFLGAHLTKNSAAWHRVSTA
ncbi:hypothetical protein JZ751_018548 [Albula glossodonta]|uniref:Uncharacterized protein n=1 Tax=Albula glossodonta TaxID=121402 RepID=A0A8T2NQE5_9TELE|nr:hypothetical protein JZ751_018548 [Albula glossodonta]